MKHFLPLSLFLVSSAAFLVAPTAHAQVVISEVMWMGTDVSTSDEWLEVGAFSCASAVTCRVPSQADGSYDLSGWSITYIDSKGVEKTMLQFPAHSRIQPDQYLVISNRSADTSRLLTPPFAVTTAVTLANTKLLLRLKNASGAVMDEVDDGVGEPFAGANPSGTNNKASMERLDLHVAGNAKSNWATATTTRGFDEGVPIFGTPGFANETTNPVLQPVPQPPPPSPPVSTGSLVPPVIEPPTGSGSTITPEPTPVQPPVPAPITNTGATLPVSTGSGSISSSTPLTPSLIPAPVGRVRITEVLPNPVGSDLQEWLELGNLGNGGIDIAGWKLKVDGHSKTFVIPHSTGSGFVLQPQQYVSFHSAQTGLQLTNAGAKILLMNAKDEVIDSFTYGKVAEGISVGRGTENEESTRPFCLPSEAVSNVASDIDVQIVVQSGVPKAEGKVSVNLAATVNAGAISTLTCQWDFGDGNGSQSCNPPSHTYKAVGSYTARLKAITYCGTTVIRELPIEVLPQPSIYRFIQPGSGSTTVMLNASQVSTCAPKTFDGVRIAGFIPAPAPGSDEWVELENTTDKTANLCGWNISVSGKPVALDGKTIEPRGRLKLLHATLGKALSNESGSIALLAPLEALYNDYIIGQHQSVLQRSIEQQVRYIKPKNGQVYAWSDAEKSFVWIPAGTGSQIQSVLDALPVKIDEVLTGTVTRVIDGRTFLVTLDKQEPRISKYTTITVRLVGIGVPNMYSPNGQEKLVGLESKKYVSDLIEGKKVELKIDTKMKDNFNRVQGSIIYDNKPIEPYLLSKGYAYVSPEDSLVPLDFVQAQKEARSALTGLWADISLTTQYAFLQDRAEWIALNQQTGSTLEVKKMALDRAGIIINEIYSHPNKDTSETEWIEFANTTNSAVSLAGLRLQTSVKTGARKYVIQGDTHINPNSLVVLELPANKLPLRNDGGSVFLLGSDGQLIDSVDFPSLKEGTAYARIRDDRWCKTSILTPGTKNQCSGDASTNSGKTSKAKVKVSTAKSTKKKKTPVLSKTTGLLTALHRTAIMAMTGSTVLSGKDLDAQQRRSLQLCLLIAIPAIAAGVFAYSRLSKHKR